LQQQQSLGEEGLEEKEGDTWASPGVNFTKRKIVV
jgi:hypothetical protein